MASLLLDVRTWVALIIVGVLLTLGWQAKSWTIDRPAADTVFENRTITKRDTVTEVVPKTVVRYDTVREVDTVRLTVPRDMRIQGVIPPSPLDFDSGEATLTYFDPSAQMWTQNVYSLPQDRWHIWPSLEVTATPSFLQASAWANVRWRRVTVSAGYVQAGARRGVGVRVALRPFTISF